MSEQLEAEKQALLAECAKLRADIMAWQNTSQMQIEAIERLQRAHDYSTNENAKLRDIAEEAETFERYFPKDSKILRALKIWRES